MNMKRTSLIILVLLGLRGQIFANDQPMFVVTGTVTNISESLHELTTSSITFFHAVKTITVTTPSSDPDTPDFQSLIAFVGKIEDGHLLAEISTDNGLVTVILGEVVAVTARPSHRKIGFERSDLLLFVATIERAELQEDGE